MRWNLIMRAADSDRIAKKCCIFKKTEKIWRFHLNLLALRLTKGIVLRIRK